MATSSDNASGPVVTVLSGIPVPERWDMVTMTSGTGLRVAGGEAAQAQKACAGKVRRGDGGGDVLSG